jgi:hypothetical protein
MPDDALPTQCANCRTPMPARKNSGPRGRDIAWMVHCKPCDALVAESMTVITHRPTGAFIDLWQCPHCKTVRACRPGWLTRCPVCLDERIVLTDEECAQVGKMLNDDRSFKRWVGEVFEVATRQITVEQTVMIESVRMLMEHEEAFARTGWTVLATDVTGMPWPEVFAPGQSHGTWAEHDACGTVQNLTPARPECRVCPPEPGSRTHRAKADRPRCLYLVRNLDLLKFGHGDGNRILAHRRGGCEVVQVLRAPHAQVVAAACGEQVGPQRSGQLDLGHQPRVRVERSRHEHMLHLESGQRKGSGLGWSAVEAVEVDRDEVERGVALLPELHLLRDLVGSHDDRLVLPLVAP